MKKIKKHNFSHVDPEKTVRVTPKSTGQKSVVEITKPDEYQLIKKDLLRTFITIGIFVLIVVGLFFVSQKTDLLKPILSKFGL
jgi:hypothetical protein